MFINLLDWFRSFGKGGVVFLVFSAYFFYSCARGCQCGKESVSVESKPAEFFFSGFVKDADTDEPIQDAFVEFKIDLDGDGLFSKDPVKVQGEDTENKAIVEIQAEETYMVSSQKDGSFHFSLSPDVSKILTGRIRVPQLDTARIITARVLSGGEMAGGGSLQSGIITARAPFYFAPITNYNEESSTQDVRAVIFVNARGYSKTSVEIPPENPGFFVIKLKKLASAYDDNPSDGIQFTLGKIQGSPVLLSGKKAPLFIKSNQGEVLMEINVPPDQVPKDVKRVSGYAAWINPTDDPTLMPASFRAKSEDGRPVMLQSGGVVEVKLEDDSGNKINPKKAKLKLKVPDNLVPTLYDWNESTTDKVEVPMWWYDEFEGLWKVGENLGVLVDEEGKIIKPSELAKIVLGKESKALYVSSDVEHLSSWNVDYPIDTHASVGGQIVDAQGNPISGLKVETRGKTYGGLGDFKGAYTDERGNFWVDVKRSEPDYFTPSAPGGVISSSIPIASDSGDDKKGIFSPLSPKNLSECEEAYKTFWSAVGKDIFALGDTLWDLKTKGLIDEQTYDILSKRHAQALQNFQKGDWNGVKNAFKDIYNGVKITDNTAGQIEAERYDKAIKDFWQTTFDTFLDIFMDLPSSLVKAAKDVSACDKFVVNLLTSEKWEIIKAFRDNKLNGDLKTLEFAASNILSMLTNEEAFECFKVEKVKQILEESKFAKFGLVISVGINYLGYGFEQFFEWLGTRGEYKSALAAEAIQDNLRSLYQKYNNLMQGLRKSGVYEQCKGYIDSALQGGSGFNVYITTSPKTKLSPKQQSDEFPQELSMIILVLEAFSEFTRLYSTYTSFFGGGSIYEVWAMPSTTEASGYSRVSVPEKYGGKERSSLLINGRVLNIITDLGVDISDFGSPIFSSTKYNDRTPKRWLGKIVLDIKFVNMTLKVKDPFSKPITNMPVWAVSGYIERYNIDYRRYAITDSNGEAKFKVPTGQVQFISGSGRYFNITTDISQDAYLEIIANLPPVINKVEHSVDSGGGKINFVGDASDPEGAPIKYKWNVWFSNGKMESQEGQTASFQMVKYGWVKYCLNADDGLATSSYCKWVYVSSPPPKIVRVDYPSEITEFSNANVKVFVENEPQDESVFFSFHIQPEDDNTYDGYMVFSSGSSITFYPGFLKADKKYKISIYVTDEMYNTSSTEITIIVKDVKLTPIVSINRSRDKIDKGEAIWFSINCVYCDGNARWDFGDGNSLEVPYFYPVSHVFSNFGVFDVRVSVKSRDDLESQDSVRIYVSRQPYLQLNLNKTSAKRGEEITYSIVSTGYPFKITIVSWDFDGDGNGDLQDFVSGDGVQLELTRKFSFGPGYSSRYYNPYVFVFDEIGQSAFASASIKLENSPPVILSFSANPNSGNAPLSVNFSVSATDDAGVSKFIFDFEDGVQVPTPSPTTTYTYYAARTYIASVRAVDTDGESSSPVTFQIVVYAVPVCPPVTTNLSANPTTGTAPLSVTFSAYASSSGYQISEVRWDFDGDGSWDEVITSSSFPAGTTSFSKMHKYPRRGTFNAVFYAANTCGNSATSSVVVSVSSLNISSLYFSCATPPESIDKYASSYYFTDFDRDKDTDLIFGFWIGSENYVWLATNSAGSYPYFSSGSTGIYVDAYINHILAPDINKDGYPDIFVSGETDSNFYCILSQGGPGSFSTPSPIPSPVSLYPSNCSFMLSLSFYDRVLAVGCSSSNDYVYVYAITTNCTEFQDINIITVPGYNDVKATDIDKDGKEDIVGINRTYHYVWIVSDVLRSGGGLSFGADLTFPLDATIQLLETGDFDGDSDIDFVVKVTGTGLTPSGPYLIWYENIGYPNFITHITLSVSAGNITEPVKVYSLSKGDINLDGSDELLVGSDNVIVVWTLAQPVKDIDISVSVDYPGPFVGDVNGDGIPDILWLSYSWPNSYISYCTGSLSPPP